MADQVTVQFSEGKSPDQETALRFDGTVRSFVTNDYDYCYFVSEQYFVGMLTQEQREQYFSEASKSDCTLMVDKPVAQSWIDAGSTIYAKVKL